MSKIAPGADVNSSMATRAAGGPRFHAKPEGQTNFGERKAAAEAGIRLIEENPPWRSTFAERRADRTGQTEETS